MVESPPPDLGASTAGNAVPQVVAGKVDQVANKVGVVGSNDADHVSVEGHGGGEDQSVLMGSITTIY
jgi:hypothetical protein